MEGLRNISIFTENLTDYAGSSMGIVFVRSSMSDKRRGRRQTKGNTLVLQIGGCAGRLVASALKFF
jgi:hypothetical protein